MGNDGLWVIQTGILVLPYCSHAVIDYVQDSSLYPFKLCLVHGMSINSKHVFTIDHFTEYARYVYMNLIFYFVSFKVSKNTCHLSEVAKIITLN